MKKQRKLARTIKRARHMGRNTISHTLGVVVTLGVLLYNYSLFHIQDSCPIPTSKRSTSAMKNCSSIMLL